MRPRLAAGLTAALVLVACGPSRAARTVATTTPATTVATTPPTTTPAEGLYSVAFAKSAQLAVHDSPDQPQPSRTLPNPVPPKDAPLALYVVDEQPDEQPEWLKVLLPVRPNGSAGWVRRSEVTVRKHDFSIVVELGAHRLTVRKGEEVFAQEPVAVGKEATPTPGGLFYTTQLIRPANEEKRLAYGDYAYALSGFSEVLTDFGGGEGVLAIHGTSDPSSIGSDVSYGCIRMTNEAITRLATTLPIGVPVEIHP